VINRGRKIIVVKDPTLELEAEHMLSPRKAVRRKETTYDFSFFSKTVSKLHEIIP